jgi:hypothetical protein
MEEYSFRMTVLQAIALDQRASTEPVPCVASAFYMASVWQDVCGCGCRVMRK